MVQKVLHTFAPISKQSELFGSDAMMFLFLERNRRRRRQRQRKVKLLAAIGYICMVMFSTIDIERGSMQIQKIQPTNVYKSSRESKKRAYMHVSS